MLGECKALTCLDLGGNYVADEGAGRLAEVLGECHALAHLVLGSNDICDEGVRRLAGVLGECRALLHRHLSENCFGAEGAEKLAKVLGEGRALAYLDVTARQSDWCRGSEEAGSCGGGTDRCFVWTDVVQIILVRSGISTALRGLDSESSSGAGILATYLA